MLDNKIKHLDMIQNIITRMASNSFALKGWAITLVVGLFAILADNVDKRFVAVAYIPLILFWLLDSYYLRLERCFRALYNHVRLKSEESIDFDMNYNKVTTSVSSSKNLCYWRCLISISELGFYGPSIAIVFIVLKVLDTI